jgi:hypothetical protein
MAYGANVKRSGSSNRKDTPAATRLEKLKRDLVVEMVVERGEFFEELQKARKRWGITPATEIPPEVPDLHYPPNEPEEHFERPYFRQRWFEDVCTLGYLVVPEAYRNPGPPLYWPKFISACLLYDPPYDDLERFAKYADPDPDTLATEGCASENGAGRRRGIAVLPIKYLIDPYRALADQQWSYKSAIEWVIKELQETQEQVGITSEQLRTIWKLFNDAFLYAPDPEGKYGSLGEALAIRQTENLPRPYIDPLSEEATKANVETARKVIRKTHSVTPNDGAPKIDSLVAVQCAILYYRDNHTLAENRRKWKWTFETLANKFNLESKRAARNHVKRGLEMMPQLREGDRVQ